MAETISTAQFKNGMHVELDRQVWKIVEFQHVKPGKGGAFVRTKLKNAETGAVVDKTFRAGEKMSRVHTDTQQSLATLEKPSAELLRPPALLPAPTASPLVALAPTWAWLPMAMPFVAAALT